ncbi:MAG: CopG family transcriptional regulator [Acidobacteriota bacterium]|nr:CopG family transcriptional regulator [Acidobacteriota bacterium]
MRTTLTLEEDLARRLKELARSSDRKFKEVVNDAIRKGLSLGEAALDRQERFTVQPKACGFRTGIDPTKLNQIYDDLELEDLRGDSGLSVHEK